MVGCHKDSNIPTVMNVEFSTDNGKSWQLIRDMCTPPEVHCPTFDLPTIFSTGNVTQWTRVTLPMPKESV